MNTTTKKYISIAVGLATVASLALAMTVSADTITGTVAAAPTTQSTSGRNWGGMQDRTPGIFGTVSAISGDTITVSSKGFGKTPTATTYTVDATNAKITKNNTVGTISSIAVGDTIMVQGAVNGTTVTATAIHDGIMQRTPGTSKTTGAHAKNGVFGTVASVNGTTLTVTSKGFGSNATVTTYTVDASSATVTKGGVTSSASNITIGDTVMVRGTITGTNVIATAIRDGIMTHVRPSSASTAN